MSCGFEDDVIAELIVKLRHFDEVYWGEGVRPRIVAEPEHAEVIRNMCCAPAKTSLGGLMQKYTGIPIQTDKTVEGLKVIVDEDG